MATKKQKIILAAAEQAKIENFMHTVAFIYAGRLEVEGVTYYVDARWCIEMDGAARMSCESEDGLADSVDWLEPVTFLHGAIGGAK